MFMNSFLTKIILLLQITEFLSHKCIHDQIKITPKINTAIEKNKSSLRVLQTTPWTPIKIYIDYSYIESQTSVSKEILDFTKKVIENTKNIFTNILSVQRINSIVKVTQACGSIKLESINPTIKTDGLDTDIIIFPFFDTAAESTTEAYASSCLIDTNTGRPNAGYMAFNPKNFIMNRTNALEYYTMLVLHEINHVLIFSDGLFSKFVDSSFNDLPKEKVVQTIDVNGVKKTAIVTPKVLETARKHFGCNSINAVELEDQGGSGTAGSHWESRVMLGDFMIGESYPENLISEISLALYDDSGWYKANYYTGGLFRYGKNKGCDFVLKRCIIDGKSNFPNDFCTNPDTPVCLSNGIAKGRCDLGDKVNSSGTTEIPASYQYFSDNPKKGGYKYADYCPVGKWESDQEKNTWFSSNCAYGVVEFAELGEIIGTKSNCFVSSLVPKNNNNTTIEKGTSRAICYPVECNSSDKTYTVTINNQPIKCTSQGAKIPDTFDGVFNCVDYSSICTKKSDCKDAIECALNKVEYFYIEPQTSTNTTPTISTSVPTTSPTISTTNTTDVSNMNSTMNTTSMNGSTPGDVNSTNSNSAELINYMKSMVDMLPLIDPKPATDYSTSSDLSNDFQNATQRLYGEFGLYYFNNCTDSRVKTLFNVEPASDDGNSYCQQLVMDWTQMYDKYQCNDWFCNNQGKCSFKVDDNQFVNPTCQCNSGYYGQNCMFNITTFSNADKWITTIQTWVSNYINRVNNTITDSKVFEDLLNMVQSVILVTSNAEAKDTEKYGNVISSLITPILSAQVNITGDVEQSLYGFMDFIFSNVDSSLSGVDPNLIVSMSDDPVKTTDTYDLQNTVVNPEEDLNLDPKAAKNTTLRFLDKNIDFNKLRYIAASTLPTNKKPAKRTLNNDSAKVSIFKDATKLLGKVSISFVANKDPKSFNSATSVTLSSYVITLKATLKANNTVINYPSGVSAMQMYIPWISVPLTIPNNDYVKNCKVYSYDGKVWNPTSSCVMQSNSTDKAAAVSCSTFGTLGVSCNGATAKRSSDSSFVMSLSYLFYLIMGIVLF